MHSRDQVERLVSERTAHRCIWFVVDRRIVVDGRKQQQVTGLTLATLRSFADACAPFDALAAVEFAAIVAARRRIGRPIGYADAQIAAIARSAGLVLATRNIRDFSDIEGLKPIDPWEGDR